MSDKAQLARQFIEAIPHARELGMDLTELDDGRATIVMPYDERLVGDPKTGVIHGGATAINRFIWPDSPAEVFLEEIAALEAIVGKVDGVVAGHSGIAFHRKIEGYQWINAGVIGLPPHDGRPYTRYAVLSEGDVVLERLEYDYHATRKAMVKAGLIQGYHETMETGVWPSEDVLPITLRR